MSPATATARALPAQRRPLQPPPLRVLPSSITDTGNGRFAAMCVGILTLGLVTLLLLNTALAKGAIEVTRLERDASLLDDQIGNLHETIDRASTTAVLARKATNLGMVRPNERAYIDLESGTVTGTAEPANHFLKLPIVASPTPVPKVAPSPSSTATPAPSASPTPAPSASSTPAPSATAPAAAEATPAAGGDGDAPTPAPTATATATSADTVDSVE